MLILTRRMSEVIRIGDDIQIHIVDISGDRVRIGIAAPTEVAVHREEIYQQIKCEGLRREAAKT